MSVIPKDARILVVEDSLSFRQVFLKILKELGYTNIIEAEDGETAWGIVARDLNTDNPVEMIIADYNMPQKTGFELLTLVRENAKTENLPFIVITTDSQHSTVLQFVMAEVSQFIIKPVKSNDVDKKMQLAWLKHHEKKSA